MHKLVVIAGPTAVGKSAIAVEVASLIGGEIISADSVQVYKGMDIGSAKVQSREMHASNGRFIPHHLLSILSPDSRFSVAEFRTKAQGLIPEIIQRNKVPILVGGSGLYIEAVIDPYQFTYLPVDDVLRANLRREAQEKGKEHLHQRLMEADPPSAKRIHPNDLKRVIRALEVFYQTGTPISQAGRRSPNREKSKYNLCYIGLEADRDYLYNCINQRVERMIANGLVKEVQGLLEAGFSPGLPALQSLGYRQIVGFLLGLYELSEAVDFLKRDTRRYAKRQLTWFKKDTRIQWYNIQNYSDHKQLAIEIAQVLSRSLGCNVELNSKGELDSID